MAEISDDSIEAVVALLQQVCRIVHRNDQHLDNATNRRMVFGIITFMDDVMLEAGVNPLSLERQQQEDARQQEAALQADVIRQVLAAPRTPRRGRSSSTESQSPGGHKRLRLSVRLQDRPRCAENSPSSSRERNSTLEHRLEGLYLAEQVIDELRKDAESHPLARASSFPAPVPPRRLKIDGTPIDRDEDMEKFMCDVIAKYYQVQKNQAAAIAQGHTTTTNSDDSVLLPDAQYSQEPSILGSNGKLRDFCV